MIEEQKTHPHYVANFRCIGHECEDSCCEGWDILLDKATYDKYQTVPAGHLRALLDNSLALNSENSSDSIYARITLNSSHSCPFFSEERLCKIQKEHGEDYLSATCSIYPRVLNKVDGVLEKSLYLSCPEAARVVLLEKDLMQAGKNGTFSNFRDNQFSIVDTENPQDEKKPYRYFWQIREFSLSLLQNRKYPLWQRLFLLGTFCEQLEKIAVEDEQNIPVLLKEYRDVIAEGSYLQALNGIDKHLPQQLDIVIRLADQRVGAAANRDRFVECFQSFIEGIQYTPDSTHERDLQHYLEAYTVYYLPFMQEHEYILENYLTNYVFKSLFPFGRPASVHHEQRSILTEYFLMLTQYALIKGMLIGMAGKYQTAFGTEHIITLIQSFSKVAEHNPTYLKEIIAFIESRDLKNPRGMAILLRN
jgi:lysine-N-methylase